MVSNRLVIKHSSFSAADYPYHFHIVKNGLV